MAQPVHPGQAAVLRSRWLWRQLLPRPAWRRVITAWALTLGSIALLVLPLSRRSAEAMSGT